ncbi:amidohydrolase family protein [Niallia endozanthoxylica]|uniref:Amidohydrolase family protein n=1 Tax=Niallia endozanthoxylica TaxID=2036016 RepID=A0A5J5HCF6_9BACI|nr:amidohydrolase family protein [Niallia endozanthoxylica]
MSSVTTGWEAFAASSKENADLILKNGVIYTVDNKRTQAEAVAVKDGVIVYVGNDEGVTPYQGSNTKIVNLKGKMVLPGFIDNHNHSYLMSESLFWLDLSSYSTLEEYKKAITDYLKEHPDVKQLRGIGWNTALVTSNSNGLQPKEWLDEIVPDIPAVFITSAHHSLWVNSKALENAKVDKNSKDPAGGVFERDPNNEPTGIVHEFSAQNLVINALPLPDFTVEEYKEALLAFQETAAQRGVTSVLVPVHYPTDTLIDAFGELEKENLLTLRYEVALWADPYKGTDQIQSFVEKREEHKGGLFQINSVKIFMDGVFAAGTAYLHDSYTHMPNHHGHPVWDQDVFKKTVAALDKEGFRVHIHAIGDAGVTASLDGFEEAAEQNGKRDSRHEITHLHLVKEEDVARFKNLGVIPVVQPFWFAKNESYAKAIGEERANHVFRMKSYFDAGIPVASASDFPVNDFWPLKGVQMGVTRLALGENDPNKVLWPEERVSLDQMITSYTMNGAYANFREEETGSIEEGKKADLVVLEKNLFEIPESEISETNILMTIFEGKEVFLHPSFKEAKVLSENTTNNEEEVSPEKASNTPILVISGFVLIVIAGAFLVIRHRSKVKQG